ncbi:hypothetical protein GCM10010156_56720 [Planobispora rosea]|uniref:SnoaL-like domain-containing protein n=1 Tax=Planobispora rosea TaxID=35762 RepID=A0A8J3WF25_PLARO|nr:nuclear transport factor 2 family protein [Planobispora rosea]GGS91050.1 hypothetical protein GCM10010156_56720 [Planobispora rosea]GIH86898.1 hypothetical protein Pro02_53060 [Planobispora rosea]
MTATSLEIYQRYVWLTMVRDADALAEMFTSDGVLESPLLPAGRAFPRRMEGREEIRKGLAAYYERPPARTDRVLNVDRSRYLVHTTADPDVFVVEIDTAFDTPGGATVMSLLKIFRMRDGKIALLRDYFAPEEVD